MFRRRRHRQQPQRPLEPVSPCPGPAERDTVLEHWHNIAGFARLLPQGTAWPRWWSDAERLAVAVINGDDGSLSMLGVSKDRALSYLATALGERDVTAVAAELVWLRHRLDGGRVQ